MTTKLSWEEETTGVIPREELVRLLSLSRLSHPRLRPVTRQLPILEGQVHHDDFSGEDRGSVMFAVEDVPAPPPAGSGTVVRSSSQLATTLVTIALTLGACVMFGMLIL
jgi:hypothetical protein